MAVEFFRLVTGDGIYKKLHDQIGPVKVDIISGTSAGGLSAAFLATALVNGSPNLDPLLRLWLKKASFETLLTSSGAKTASSLFNGDHFLELIEEALNQIGRFDREPSTIS
jgi:predicted acylesterase/phospholipase RssA